jgi:hypothetical protein
MARGRHTDPTAAVLAKVMHEMGFPPAWIAELHISLEKQSMISSTDVDPRPRCHEMKCMTKPGSN